MRSTLTFQPSWLSLRVGSPITFARQEPIAELATAGTPSVVAGRKDARVKNKGTA